MYNSTAKLIEAADILEKVAEYLDAEEQEMQAKHAAAIQQEYIEPISEAVESIPKSMQAKLANVDTEVLDFFKNAIGTRKSGSGYQPLGGAAEKVASDESDPLLSFCLGDD